MRNTFLNCTKTHECTSTIEPTSFHAIMLYCIAVSSAIGITNSFMSSYILFTVKSMKTPFFRFMNIYTLNSLLISLNDFVVVIVFFLNSKDLFFLEGFDYVDNYQFIFMFSRVSVPIWVILYSNASLLDICILLNRVLVFYPDPKSIFKIKSIYRFEIFRINFLK